MANLAEIDNDTKNRLIGSGNLPLLPLYEEELTPSAYMGLFEKDREEIEEVYFSMPPLGMGFPRIIVRHRTPTYGFFRATSATATITTGQLTTKSKSVF